MSRRLYRIYRAIAISKLKIRRKVSKTGELFLFFGILSLIFGLNTRLTMIYQLAAITLMLIAVAFPLSYFFKPAVRVRRVLPQTCTAENRLCYSLQLENNGPKKESGLFFTEISGTPLPTFAEICSSEEQREASRNFIDRKLGYYRWLSLLEQTVGVQLETSALPALELGEKRRIEVYITPLRRGYIQLAGYSIFRLEPLGMFKKELFVEDSEKILVLPKLYPVIHFDLGGSRRYHQGGVSGATRIGDTGEFVALREYRPGDQVKHIDWKATAKYHEPIVRQFQDEYFSRYGVVLDTFTGSRDKEVFEDAVSVAASIIVNQDKTSNLIDLLFAGDTCISSLSTGRGQSTQSSMLEVLACIKPCTNKNFKEFSKTVIAHTPLLSGLLLVFIDLDQARADLINYLVNIRIPHKVILITSEPETSAEQKKVLALPDVQLFDIQSTTKVVDLS